MGTPKAKPIHVAYSHLTQRFYAFRAYKRVNPESIRVTGQKFDVTDEIARAIIKYNLEFSKEVKSTGKENPA